MSILWTGEEMVAAMEGRPLGALPSTVSGISIDTRTLQPGDAFFAIRGERFDGHDFLSAAIAAGASLLVVSEAKLPALGGLTRPMIVVDDVLDALRRLGIAARARMRGTVIAVTGSVGKTSTKEALRLALSPSGAVHAAVQSFNNHWGVPLTLARMPADTDYGIFEIGMNHPGEIRPLARMVRPHLAIVTRVAAAHLGQFRNLEQIADAKAEIFEGVEPGGHALINRDDPQWTRLSRAAEIVGVRNISGFGSHPDSRYALIEFSPGEEGSAMTVRFGGTDRQVVIGAPGRHMAQNGLAVIGAAHLVGADVDKAIAALAELRPEKGRGRRLLLAVPGGGILTVIDESYNANPASMRAALEILALAAPQGNGRRIAVLGDMRELGAQSAELHADLAEAVRASCADRVFLGGEEMAALHARLAEEDLSSHFQDVAEVSQALLEEVRAGDVIMIKSSNSVGFSRIVDALVDRFPPVPGQAEPVLRQ